MSGSSISSDGRVAMCGSVRNGGTAKPEPGETELAASWEGEWSIVREGRCLCFLGEPWINPSSPRLPRRLVLDLFLLCPDDGEARLDVVELDQRLRFRKLSLNPPTLLDRDVAPLEGVTGSILFSA